MIKSITVSSFRDAFRDIDRQDNFSYKGLGALFEHLEQYEDDTGAQVELDVIALCCDYQEDELSYFLEQYELDTVDDLRDNTTVIEIEGTDDIIIQSY